MSKRILISLRTVLRGGIVVKVASEQEEHRSNTALRGLAVSCRCAKTSGMVMVGTGDEGVRRLPAGRKAELAAYVAEVGEASVATLAERFNVSVDTIRRDLDALDAEGHLIRTHGGAVGVGAAPKPEFAVDVRMRMQADAKDAIGELAASLVADGMVLMMNAGTTTLAIGRPPARQAAADDRDEQPPAACRAVTRGRPRSVPLRRRGPLHRAGDDRPRPVPDRRAPAWSSASRPTSRSSASVR